MLTDRTAREASMWKEFREFALRGNVVDMAVGIIIGAAFGTIVKSLVDDVIMPPIGLLLGGVDFSNFFLLFKEGSPAAPYASLADARAAGAVTVNYGVFLNAVISFLVVALVIFFLIRMMNRLRREEAPAQPTTKECPFCLSAIPLKATRCAYCTSDLTAAG
jgi:large conductance mechanosensitive channel